MESIRDAVLAALVRLERRHGRDSFALSEIVQEVLAARPEAKVSSVQTHVVSAMCREAPVNHANHTDDLERVGRGRYRRLNKGSAPRLGEESGQPIAPTPKPPKVTPGRDLIEQTRQWPWEGAVQSALVDRLVANGWVVEKQADTERGEQGADVVATRDGVRLLVEVKGYPFKEYQRGPKAGEPKKTNPVLQARHWFADGVLTALLRRGDDPLAQVVIALPEYPTYRRLAGRVSAPLVAAGVEIWFVKKP